MSKRVALVIGNQDYDGNARALMGPRNDATHMARLFSDLGFMMLPLQLDADYGAIRRSLRLFADQLETGGLAVFYYAGHGIQGPAGGNYLMPVDARLHEPEDIGLRCYPVSSIIEAIAGKRCTGLLFLDACRDDPFAGVPEAGERTRSVIINNPGLGRSSAAGPLIDVLISYATAPGNTAIDGETGVNSPYTAALLKFLKEPGLSIDRVLRRVRNQVNEATRGCQTPWEEGSLLADNLVLAIDPQPPAEPPQVMLQQTPPSPPLVPPEDLAKADPPQPPLRPPSLPARPVSLSLLFAGATVALLVLAALAIGFVHLVLAPCDRSTPDRALSCDIAAIEQGPPDSLDEATGRLVMQLNNPSLSEQVKARIVIALLSLIQPARMKTMSDEELFRVLRLLAPIPAALWLDPAMLSALETAHNKIAELDAAAAAGIISLGFSNTDALNALKAQAGYVPRNTITVVPQFAGYSRSDFQALMDALKTGWGWTNIWALDEEPDKAAGRADVRYSSDDMKASATLLAGQLNGIVTPSAVTVNNAEFDRVKAAVAGIGLPKVSAKYNDNISPRRLEIWIGKP